MTDDFDTDVFNDDSDEVVTEDKAEVSSGTEKVEKEEEVTATPEDKDKIIEGLHKARDAERHKRQEAEAKLKQQEAVPEVVPDPVIDPEGNAKYVLGKVDAKILRSKIEQSQELMRELKEDYEDMEKVFLGVITNEAGEVTDRKLLNEFNNSVNPARFAYNHAVKHLDFLNKTDENYEANLRSKIAAELLADYKQKGLGALDLPNLTNAAASASNTDKLVEYEGDDYLWRD